MGASGIGHTDLMDESWLKFRDDLSNALRAFVRGDAGPYKALWSHSADTSIMGAFGGYNRGWDDIAKRLDWAAAQYRDGVYDRFEVLADVAGTDLAYLTWREQISSAGVDGQMLVRRRRGTQIHRREGSHWRIIHQHSDPLVEVQAP